MVLNKTHLEYKRNELQGLQLKNVDLGHLLGDFDSQEAVLRTPTGLIYLSNPFLIEGLEDIRQGISYKSKTDANELLAACLLESKHVLSIQRQPDTFNRGIDYEKTAVVAVRTPRRAFEMFREPQYFPIRFSDYRAPEVHVPRTPVMGIGSWV